MLVLHGFVVRVGCPWAWWWLVWHEWHTSWYLRKDQQGKPRWLLEEPWQQSLGIGDQFWSLERFLAQAAGMATCGSKARCSFGNDGSLGVQQFLACICVVSWHHQLQVQIFVQPWWPTVFGELFLQCSYERFAWFVPFSKYTTNSRINVLSNQGKKNCLYTFQSKTLALVDTSLVG